MESDKATLASKRVDLENTLQKEEAQKEVVEQGLDSMIEELSGYRVKAEDLRTRASDGASRLAALTERRDAVSTDIDQVKESIVELDVRLNANLDEQNSLTSRDENLTKAIVAAEAELASSLETQADKTLLAKKLESEISAISTLIDATDSALKIRRRELDEVREKRSEEEVRLAKEEAEIVHLNESFTNAHNMTINEAAILLNPVELLRDDSKLQEELSNLKDKLDAIGPVNPMAHEEFSELERRYGFITKQQTDLEESIKSTEIAIGRIDRTSRQRFKEAFDAINEEFSVTFRQLFGGGSASLHLVEEKDVLESGIEIIAQPPGKKLQNVLLLSGGEKAMTAIALLFAIFRYRPSPFCLLDEVDAPLDDANVGRFLSMVRELRETTQFIVITHNRKTMEMADHLYGITMAEPGVSKLVSVNFSTDDTANVKTVVSTA